MTLFEFFAAVDGYLESKGVKKGDNVKSMTRGEYNQLLAKLRDEGKI